MICRVGAATGPGLEGVSEVVGGEVLVGVDGASAGGAEVEGVSTVSVAVAGFSGVGVELAGASAVGAAASVGEVGEAGAGLAGSDLP